MTGSPSTRRHRIRRDRRAAAAATIPALTLSIGCVPSTPTVSPTVATPPPASLAPAVRERDERVGIEVRQWLVEADAVLIASATAAWARGGEFPGTGEADSDAAPSEVLLAEGVSVAAGPTAELPAVLEALGGTRTDLKVWHGQALEWRDLVGVNLPRSTIAVAGGRPRAIPAGRLSLQMRGWVQPMEEGAACEIELAVRWKPLRRASIGLAPEPSAPAAWIGDLAVQRSVERGEALVVTAMPRRVAEGGGPPVETPPTLGELMLDPPAPGVATVLVVWPSLPDWLHPAPEDDSLDELPPTGNGSAATEADAGSSTIGPR